MKFIDLFCGIGGFHQALSNMDFECVFSCDLDKNCRRCYEDNYGIKPEGDIRSVPVESIPEFDILCAGLGLLLRGHVQGHDRGGALARSQQSRLDARQQPAAAQLFLHQDQPVQGLFRGSEIFQCQRGFLR